VASLSLDCDAGRRLGCHSYCCRLLVRLDPGERDPTEPHNSGKRFIDKHPDSGRCIHQVADSGLCGIYERRPRVCRDYDCNHDRMLTVVLRDGCSSIVETSRKALNETNPASPTVPYVITEDRSSKA
jgi:uncharacterized protein